MLHPSEVPVQSRLMPFVKRRYRGDGDSHDIRPRIRPAILEFILLAGMNEMFSLPIGASQRLNCDRVRYNRIIGNGDARLSVSRESKLSVRGASDNELVMLVELKVRPGMPPIHDVQDKYHGGRSPLVIRPISGWPLVTN